MDEVRDKTRRKCVNKLKWKCVIRFDNNDDGTIGKADYYVNLEDILDLVKDD